MTVKTLHDLENANNSSEKRLKIKNIEPGRKEDEISQVTMDSPHKKWSELERKFVKLQRQSTRLLLKAR